MLFNSFKIIAYVCKDANTFGIKKQQHENAILKRYFFDKMQSVTWKERKKKRFAPFSFG
jgi:hypothetical protein